MNAQSLTLMPSGYQLRSRALDALPHTTLCLAHYLADAPIHNVMRARLGAVGSLGSRSSCPRDLRRKRRNPRCDRWGMRLRLPWRPDARVARRREHALEGPFCAAVNATAVSPHRAYRLESPSVRITLIRGGNRGGHAFLSLLPSRFLKPTSTHASSTPRTRSAWLSSSAVMNDENTIGEASCNGRTQ